MTRNLLIVVFILLCLKGLTQSVNDECFSATNISDLSNFCSVDFNNIEATTSTEDPSSCWNDGVEAGDIWYSFTPRNGGLLLRFFGSGENSEFTIDNVGIGLYQGSCNALSEVDCVRRNQGADDSFERVYSDLTIGRLYYLRISSGDGNKGTFQLCLSEFAPIPEPQQDCDRGVVLCDKSTFVVEKLEGVGLIPDEAVGSCLDGLGPSVDPTRPPEITETSSVWYRWTAATSGSLTFTLFPNNDDSEEDLDFAIYRLPLGINDCSNKEILRCMASGAPNPGDDICLGPTGLREGETDEVEFVNCENGSNNFLAPLQMVAGESYVLIVNNFSNSGFGFSVEFGGTGEFLGPVADFDFTTVDDFECDKTITFENLSNSMTDEIVNFQWRFGEGALPESAIGEGPHDVVYQSFGPKVAVLTVETARGCLVTKIIDLEVEPCCDDLQELILTPIISDLSCFGSADGSVEAQVQNGSPEYLFSLDGGPLNPTRIYNGLSPGTYTLSALDVKGCMVTDLFTINEPVEINLNISSLQDSIELGEGTQFFSDFSPADKMLTYSWSPPDGLSCTDCPNPEVIPPGSTTYTLTVIDQDGCVQSADILIVTSDFKPFYAPNIITLSPMVPGNGFFRGHSNIAADFIEVIAVYDRWGGELYIEENVRFDDVSYTGWNGIVSGSNQKVNPGVYVWFAQVRFIDGELRTFTGDLTVIH